MGDLVRMFEMGGPLMYAVGLLWLMVPVLALVLGGASAFRIWIPAVVWLLMPALVSMAGAAGWIHGQRQTLYAIGAASAEMKDVLLYAGSGISMYTQWFGLYLAAAALLGTAFCAALGNAIGVGKGEVRWTLGGAGGALVLSFLVAAAPAALAFVRRSPTVLSLALTVLLAGAALVVVGLRRAEEGADARRCAAARFQVALYGLLAIVAMATGLTLHGRSMAFEALSNAAPEMMQALLWSALQNAEVAVGGGIMAGIGFMLASLPVVGPSLRHLGGARGFIGGMLTLMLLLVAFALPAVASWYQGRVMSSTGAMRALTAADQATQLPAPGAVAGAVGPFDAILVHGDSGWTRVDESHLAYAPSTEFDPTSPLLVLRPSVRARKLLTADWMNADVTDLHVLARADSFGTGDEHELIRAQRLSTADLERYRATGEGAEEAQDLWGYGYGSTPTSANSVFVIDGSAHERADLWGLSGSAESVWLVGPQSAAAPIGSVQAAAEGLDQRAGELGVEYVVFVPGDTWSVQDLVTLCHSLQGSGYDGWSYGTTRARCAFTAELPAER
jgi:hypothetical protein